LQKILVVSSLAKAMHGGADARFPSLEALLLQVKTLVWSAGPGGGDALASFPS
jgi:hypothetical protein